MVMMMMVMMMMMMMMMMPLHCKTIVDQFFLQFLDCICIFVFVPKLMMDLGFHPSSEHFMYICNRLALQGPLDFNRYFKHDCRIHPHSEHFMCIWQPLLPVFLTESTAKKTHKQLTYIFVNRQLLVHCPNSSEHSRAICSRGNCGLLEHSSSSD